MNHQRSRKTGCKVIGIRKLDNLSLWQKLNSFSLFLESSRLFRFYFAPLRAKVWDKIKELLDKGISVQKFYNTGNQDNSVIDSYNNKIKYYYLFILFSEITRRECLYSLFSNANFTNKFWLHGPELILALPYST